MSTYGSGTGPEYLDEPPWDDDPPFAVTTPEGGTSYHRDWDVASGFADAFAELGVAVSLSIAREVLWSFEPGRNAPKETT